MREGVSKCKFRHTLLSCVRVSKMQGAEIEDDGSVLKYMTKSEIEEQRSSLLIMTQRLLVNDSSLFLTKEHKDIFFLTQRRKVSQSICVRWFHTEYTEFLHGLARIYRYF